MRKIVVLLLMSQVMLFGNSISSFYGGIFGKYLKMKVVSKRGENVYHVSYLIGRVEFEFDKSKKFSIRTGLGNYFTSSPIVFFNLPISVEKRSEGISNYLIGGELIILSYNKKNWGFGGVFSFDYYTGEEKNYEFQLKSFSGDINIKSKFLNAKTGLILELRKKPLLIQIKGLYSFLDAEFTAEEKIYEIKGEDSVKFYPGNDIIIGINMKYTIRNFMRITLNSEFLQVFSVGMGVEYVF